MKLRLNTKNLNKPKTEAEKIHNSLPEQYSSPVGWWAVTTEGDCEGKSTQHLGTYYGHVAEIAFFLADRAYYGLRFDPSTSIFGKPSIIPTYEATKDHVWVSLGIESGTWHLNDRARWFEKWLNVTDPVINVKPKSPDGSCYYASVYLSLVKA